MPTLQLEERVLYESGASVSLNRIFFHLVTCASVCVICQHFWCFRNIINLALSSDCISSRSISIATVFERFEYEIKECYEALIRSPAVGLLIIFLFHNCETQQNQPAINTYYETYFSAVGILIF